MGAMANMFDRHIHKLDETLFRLDKNNILGIIRIFVKKHNASLLFTQCSKWTDCKFRPK
jgi:hypothetical protein